MAMFYKKLNNSVGNFYKKLNGGVNNFFTKTIPSVGLHIKQGLSNANTIANKIGNTLEKAVPLISNVGSAVASFAGNPELAYGFNRASGLVSALKSGLKDNQAKVNDFANRLQL